MKTKKSTQQSADARMRDAKRAAEAAHYTLRIMESNGVCGETMRELRQAATDLNQAVHEFNAYHNVVTTT
jgi:hypothetical protein